MSTTLFAFFPQASDTATTVRTPAAAAQRIQAATPSGTIHGHDAPAPDGQDCGTREAAIAAALARAYAAGITAVWTGPCAACVDLARLAGPEHYEFNSAEGTYFGLPGAAPWHLSDANVRATVYRHVLTSGTQFDIYRWVNLIDLATVWPSLRLPRGVRSEWQGALQAAGLLPLPRR